MAAGMTYDDIERALSSMQIGDKMKKMRGAKILDDMHSRAPRWLRSADVAAYRDYFVDEKVEPLGFVPEWQKDNKKSARFRQEGNKLYHEKHFDGALERYNESIAWAAHDSEDLGLAYANCSAAQHTLGLYEHALLSIALAKKSHYPEQLMPKLLKRESDCRKMIPRRKESQFSLPDDLVELNVKRNRRIPFLASGISMKVFPGFGRGLVADRDFDAGDVILDEELVACTVSKEQTRGNCHHCSAVAAALGPITCSKCVSVLFCSEKCHDAGMKAFHRFECGIAERLDHISYGATRIGLRMFFLGLNLFNDDVEQMMSFCKAHGRTGPNPLEMDYSVSDPLRAFRLFHQTVVPKVDLDTDKTRLQAALYYSVLIRQPTVQTVIVTQAHKDFMLHCLCDYIRTALFLASYHVDLWTTNLYTIGALCNQACSVPNTLAISCDGRLKFVLLRPVRKNEQLLTSYLISFVDVDYDSPYLQGHIPGKCVCPTCKPSAARLANANSALPVSIKHVQQLNHKMAAECSFRTKLNALQVFVQRYGHLHPDYKLFDEYIDNYRRFLTVAFHGYIQKVHRFKSTDRLK